MEVRKNATSTTPSTQSRLIELSSSKDEVQRWVNEQREKGQDIVSILDFDFMHIGIELVGGKIMDTPIGELL